MKIDWQARIRNPQFWFQIAISIATPVGAYFGLKAQDVTSWPIMVDVLGKAVSNPYVLMLVASNVYTTIVNSNTKGVKD
ncbi:phage holin family protein [Latilactobacillus curvatus]|uniref:phage holin n=1 Tax=Latilactobacillus curvatus TaxID=28038 RepID=UPI0020C817EA|nr:phage holin [Latilactobacillus curvatus]MCP8849197.1 phage holin family protein [Latilactobacillus curvatus]